MSVGAVTTTWSKDVLCWGIYNETSATGGIDGNKVGVGHYKEGTLKHPGIECRTFG